MKKYCLFFVALAALLVSCSKDNGTSVLKIKASKYTQAGDSKVVLESNYAVWAPGDKIKINGVIKTVGEAGNDIEIEVDTADSYTLVYPSSLGPTNGAANIPVTLSNTQFYQSYQSISGVRQNIAAPMLGYVSGSRPTEMLLTNLCALVRFRVGNAFLSSTTNTVQVKNISFVALGANLSGSGEVQNVASTPKLVMGTPNFFTGSVSLDCSSSRRIAYALSLDYYLVVPPTECGPGALVTVTYQLNSDPDSAYKLELNRALRFEPGRIYNIDVYLGM